jgi:CcmD family protein
MKPPARFRRGAFEAVDFDVIPRQTARVSSLAYLAIVNVVVWVGLFLYLWRIDRRISEQERNR